MPPMLLDSLWTPEQVLLSVGILVCTGLLLLRPRLSPNQPPPGTRTGKKPPERQTAPAHGRTTRRATLLVAAVLVAAGVFLAARGGHPIGVRPDSWSEANVVVSGRNYARLGLWANYGAAQHQVVTDTNPPDPLFIYTRYPIGPNLVNGLWQKLGIVSHAAFRVLPIACSLATVVIWFILLRRRLGPAPAAAASVILATSYGYLAYADHLHAHAYGLFAATAAIACFMRAMEPATSRRGAWLLGTGGLMFVAAWMTWEYDLWLFVFIGLYALLFVCPVRRGWLVVLVLPLAVAVGMQAGQRRLASGAAVGSMAEATATSQPSSGFFADLYRRTLDFEGSADTPPGLTLGGYPAALLLRYYKFYGLPAVGALAVLLLVLSRDGRAPWRWRQWDDGQRLTVILLVAGTGWWLTMMQHTAVHPHTMRLGLLGYVLLVAIGLSRCWEAVCGGPWWRRAAGVGLAALLAYPQAEGLVTDFCVHFRGGLLDSRERGDAGSAEASRMPALADFVPPSGVILTNHTRLPAMRLWSERPVYDGRLARAHPLAPADSRSMLEMSFAHIQSLYGRREPPLYYAYLVRSPTFAQAFADDGLLRLMLTGSTDAGVEAWNGIQPAMKEAMSAGKTERSACPIVGIAGNIVVFNLEPLLPRMQQSWSAGGNPTLDEYGPPR